MMGHKCHLDHFTLLVRCAIVFAKADFKLADQRNLNSKKTNNISRLNKKKGKVDTSQTVIFFTENWYFLSTLPRLLYLRHMCVRISMINEVIDCI